MDADVKHDCGIPGLGDTDYTIEDANRVIQSLTHRLDSPTVSPLSSVYLMFITSAVSLPVSLFSTCNAVKRTSASRWPECNLVAATQ